MDSLRPHWLHAKRCVAESAVSLAPVVSSFTESTPDVPLASSEDVSSAVAAVFDGSAAVTSSAAIAALTAATMAADRA